jgi:hypothetical protein
MCWMKAPFKSPAREQNPCFSQDQMGERWCSGGYIGAKAMAVRGVDYWWGIEVKTKVKFPIFAEAMKGKEDNTYSMTYHLGLLNLLIN